MGDTILPLVDAATDEGIEFMDTRHEEAAMHMADGYSRITGQPAVALFTSGPGFANTISRSPPSTPPRAPSSSAATNATDSRIRAARTVMSSRFPMGVPIT